MGNGLCSIVDVFGVCLLKLFSKVEILLVVYRRIEYAVAILQLVSRMSVFNRLPFSKLPHPRRGKLIEGLLQTRNSPHTPNISWT
jgi:hypothetical protein